jgi:uncharacterized protein (DUF2336 family)
VNHELLRALIGVQDCLLAASRLVDDPILVARIREVGIDITRLIARVTRTERPIDVETMQS